MKKKNKLKTAQATLYTCQNNLQAQEHILQNYTLYSKNPKLRQGEDGKLECALKTVDNRIHGVVCLLI